MPHALATRAPAKINLTLHIVGRRADGYHELESLVAFAGTGDDLRLEPGAELRLDIDGPTAGPAGGGPDNLVLKASRLLVERIADLRVGTFRLTKRLPVAAGIGGGSADAAAALRLLARLNGLKPSHAAVQEAARLAGADVPVCLEPQARMMRGVGERLGPALRLPPLFAVLVNPRLPVETRAVFKALGLEPGRELAGASHPDPDRLSGPTLLDGLKAARNDLEPPARRLQPTIGEALDLLAAMPGCVLARMSGSGATVFGLCHDRPAAERIAALVRQARPEWWVRATGLR